LHEGVFDLGGVETNATNLDLFVDAAKVGEPKILIPDDQIARTIEPAVVEFDERLTLARVVVTVEITTGYSVVADQEFAWGPEGDTCAARINDSKFNPGRWRANWYCGLACVGCRVDVVDHATNDCFCRTVFVEDGHVGVVVKQSFGQIRAKGLAADDTRGQLVVARKKRGQNLQV